MGYNAHLKAEVDRSSNVIVFLRPMLKSLLGLEVELTGAGGRRFSGLPSAAAADCLFPMVAKVQRTVALNWRGGRWFG